MEIIIANKLDDKSWAHLTNWAECVFPKEGKAMQWAPLGWHVLALDEGQPVAHIGFDRFSLSDSGLNISVIGIGAVVVRPEFQKKGIPARLFEQLHADCPINAQTAPYTLFCPDRLVPYYQKHGYEKIERPVEIQQFGKPILTDFAFMARGREIQRTGGPIVVSGPPW